jgi:eukaryotic-like serine/threonine-protein kinase
VLDASRGTSTRLTFDPARDDFPVWSPDGRRIAFASSRGGNFDLYQKASDGSGDDQLLLKSDEDRVPSSWSPDSRFLLYRAVGPKTGNDLWVLPLEGDRKPVPFLRTEFSEQMGQFSPDGHWIAYMSNESGNAEIYVRPFSPNSAAESSNSGGKWMISKGGAIYPHWRSDGKQLFYGTLDGNVVAVDVTSDKTFQAGAPKRLFSSPSVVASGFDVTAGGKQFLIGAPQGTGTPAPFTVVLNWRAGLKK